MPPQKFAHQTPNISWPSREELIERAELLKPPRKTLQIYLSEKDLPTILEAEKARCKEKGLGHVCSEETIRSKIQSEVKELETRKAEPITFAEPQACTIVSPSLQSEQKLLERVQIPKLSPGGMRELALFVMGHEAVHCHVDGEKPDTIGQMHGELEADIVSAATLLWEAYQEGKEARIKPVREALEAMKNRRFQLMSPAEITRYMGGKAIESLLSLSKEDFLRLSNKGLIAFAQEIYDDVTHNTSAAELIRVAANGKR